MWIKEEINKQRPSDRIKLLAFMLVPWMFNVMLLGYNFLNVEKHKQSGGLYLSEWAIDFGLFN